MITASIGSMYYLAGVAGIGGFMSLVIRAMGGQIIANVIDAGLAIFAIAFVAPMFFDFFNVLENFGFRLGL